PRRAEGARLVRRLRVVVRRRPPEAQPSAHPRERARAHGGIGRDEQGPQAPWFSLRRVHDLLRIHASVRPRRRPHRNLLSRPAKGEMTRALALCLLALGACKPVATSPTSGDAGTVALATPDASTGPDGATLYASMCAVCHGPDAKGYRADNAPSLVNPTFLE